MGNMKYPLNGKRLTLGDLIYEYGFNTARPVGNNSNDLLGNYNKVIDNIVNLPTINIFNETFISDCSFDLYMDDNNITSSNSSIYKEFYTSFKNDMQDQNIEGRCKDTYEICYFPDVYSNTQRTEDNKSYKLLLSGDYKWYSPDRYITFADVNTNIPELEMRIPVLFHYVCANINLKDSKYNERFSFNYKRSDGMATASYALLELYKLDLEIADDEDISLNNNNVSSIKDLIFGKDIQLSDDISSDVSVVRPLLFNFNDNANEIILDNIVLPTAYKYLQNYQYRKDGYHIKNGQYVLDNKSTLFIDLLNNVFKIDELEISDVSIFNNATYLEYNFESANKAETIELKKYNLYWKVRYYCDMLISSQTYKTGLILDAKFDVLNERHIYRMTDPLYRCDIGANISVSDVKYDDTNGQGIICNYALPARALHDDDKLSVTIPVKILSALNTYTVTIYKQWTMAEITKLLNMGRNINNDLDDLEKNPPSSYEYMVLYRKVNDNDKFKQFKENNVITIDKVCLSSLRDLPEIGLSPYCIRVNDIADVSEDSSLNIYNPKTNKGWNTSDYIITDNNDDLFVGKLYANIKYTQGIYFNCVIPIYRLANYYYKESIVLARTNYIYFINFAQISEDQASLLNSIPCIEYAQNKDSHSSTCIIYGNIPDKIYLSSKIGNKNKITYITGTIVEKDEEGTPYIRHYIKVNNATVNAQINGGIKPPQYILSNPSLSIYILFYLGETESIDTTNIEILPYSSYSSTQSITYSIYNIQEKPVSILVHNGNKSFTYTDMIAENKQVQNLKGDNMKLYLCTEQQGINNIVLPNYKNYRIIVANNSSKTITSQYNLSTNNYIDNITNNDIIYIYNSDIYRFCIEMEKGSGKILEDAISSINETEIKLPGVLKTYNLIPNIIYSKLTIITLEDDAAKDFIDHLISLNSDYSINSINADIKNNIKTYTVQIKYNESAS